MPAFDAFLDRFAEQNAQVVGISADSIPCHIAWQQHSIGTLHFPLASDFYPHGAVCEQFGLLRQGPPVPGIPERAVVIVDKDGKVAWKKVYELDQQPDPKEVLDEVTKLN